METATTQQPTGFASILQENDTKMRSIKAYEKAQISTKARNIAFAGMTLGTMFILGLFAVQIIQGVFSLVVAGAFCIGSYFGLRFLKSMDPLIKQKTKNFKIEQMVKEARIHSIAQLDNQVLKNHKRLQTAREARDQMGALVEGLRSKIDPANVGKAMHTKKTELLNRVKTSYDKIVVNVDKAAATNKIFEEKVKDYKEMDAFAELANAAMSCIGSAGVDKLDEMLSLSAFEQIETDFNSSLISIENSARDMAIDN